MLNDMYIVPNTIDFWFSFNQVYFKILKSTFHRNSIFPLYSGKCQPEVLIIPRLSFVHFCMTTQYSFCTFHITKNQWSAFYIPHSKTVQWLGNIQILLLGDLCIQPCFWKRGMVTYSGGGGSEYTKIFLCCLTNCEIQNGVFKIISKFT